MSKYCKYAIDKIIKFYNQEEHKYAIDMIIAIIFVIFTFIMGLDILRTFLILNE